MSDLVEGTASAGILSITLPRPEKRNALNRAVIAALAETFTSWRDRDDLAVAVLTGEGDKACASGGDLRELDAVRTEEEALAFARATILAFDAIRRSPCRSSPR